MPAALKIGVILLGQLIASCGSSVSGRLLDGSGQARENVLVRLISIDDKGIEHSQLEVTTTDASGTFYFETKVKPISSLVMVAELPEGLIKGFFAGNGRHYMVSSLTQALFDLIIDITRTQNGRRLTDFSTQELRHLLEQAQKISAINEVNDMIEIKEILKLEIGRLIAEAAGGEITVKSADMLEESEAAHPADFVQDTRICPINAAFFLLESSQFRFDIERDGTLCGGTHATFSSMLSEGALELYFPEEEFFIGGKSFPSSFEVALLSSRQLRFGPYALKKLPVSFPDPPEVDALEVSRKVYVPPTGDYIRYLEKLENTGTTARSIRLRLRSFLETGSESVVLTHSEMPGGVTLANTYVAAVDVDQDRPTVIFLAQDGFGGTSLSDINVPGKAGGQSNEVSYFWDRIDIPAGATRTLLHYAFLTTSRSEEFIDEKLDRFLAAPDMKGLDITDLQGLVNFSPREGTVVGEAGSVMGGVLVTAKNQTTGQRLSVRAYSDGSFAIPLTLDSGETVEVTAEDGLKQIFTLP